MRAGNRAGNRSKSSWARRHTRQLRLQRLEDRCLLAANPFIPVKDSAGIPDAQGYRSFDGSGNNLGQTEWGAANTPLRRLTQVEYGDGNAGAFPALAPRLDSTGQTIDPRAVSNVLMNQDESLLNDRGLTGFTFQWGQFLDHDMDLTEDFLPVGEVTLPGEFIPFFVTDPTDELPLGTMIPMLRSRFVWDDAGVAQQINQITSYIDASNVYGSSEERASALRSGYGGLLLTSDGVANVGDGSGAFLPLNTLGLENAAPPTTGTGVPIEAEELFVAGDVRANEQPGLTSLHTLFLREHNFQASRLAERWGLEDADLARVEVDESLFQVARAITNAEIQSITYNEFLPALLGPNQLESYRGYQSDVNAAIANIFSASLYRVGHTMLPEELLLFNEDGSPVADDPDVLGAVVQDGQVALADAFFNRELVTQYGIEPYLRGLAEQPIQEIDSFLVDAVRNLLFDPPAAVDLGATNLQRARDHGLPDYNQARRDFGLEPVASISEISSDPSVVARLESAYDQAGDGIGGYRAVENIDVFAAAISEDHIAGGSVGELLHTVLVDQFTRLRDGDRFYYENVFGGSRLQKIQDTRLADVIRRNTQVTAIQDEVFRDDRVLTYRGLHSDGDVDVMVRLRGEMLEVVDRSTRDVVASQSADSTDILVIFGTSKRDRIRLDASLFRSWQGSVEIHGGAGRDRLMIEVPKRATRASSDFSAVHVNDVSVYFGNVEQVRKIRPSGLSRADLIQLRDISSEFNIEWLVDRWNSGLGPNTWLHDGGLTDLQGEATKDILGEPLRDDRADDPSRAEQSDTSESLATQFGPSRSEDSLLPAWNLTRDWLFGLLGTVGDPLQY